MNRATYNWLDQQASLKRFYKELQKDNQVCQVTVTNHTDDIRKVCLWGANSAIELTEGKSFKNSFDKILETAQNPVDVIYNQATNKYYIINEGADALTVLNTDGFIEGVIDLNSNSNVDIKGPISISYNSNTSHPNFGDMAIACKRADQLLIIDTAGELKQIVNTGTEPVDVIFNTFNSRFYVANSKSTYITIVDQSYQPYPLNDFDSPIKLGFNSSNGDLLVYDNGLKELVLIGEAGAFKNKVSGVSSDYISIDFNSELGFFYVTNYDNGEIYTFTQDSLDTQRKFLGISQPLHIFYQEDMRFIRVINGAEKTLVTLTTDFDIIGSESLENFDNFILKGSSTIFLSSSSNQIRIRGTIQSPTVTVNEEYYENREDFQHNPAMVSHVKLVASGEDRINALQLIEKSVTGTEISKTISLSNSQSPQNFANVSELFDMNGNLIDGHVTWCFKINPKQQVTFLIYYHQFEMYNLLPEKTRISTGVQMSKGIPASWLDNLKEEPPDESTY
jgi:hypothetical protein